MGGCISGMSSFASASSFFSILSPPGPSSFLTPSRQRPFWVFFVRDPSAALGPITCPSSVPPVSKHTPAPARLRPAQAPPSRRPMGTALRKTVGHRCFTPPGTTRRASSWPASLVLVLPRECAGWLHGRPRCPSHLARLDHDHTSVPSPRRGPAHETGARASSPFARARGQEEWLGIHSLSPRTARRPRCNQPLDASIPRPPTDAGTRQCDVR
jgi:hypothetical protein